MTYSRKSFLQIAHFDQLTKWCVIIIISLPICAFVFCTMSRRNARERKRVRVINDMLRILREKLPEEWTSKKMNKLEILRKSTLYIRRLIELNREQSFRGDHKYCAVLGSGSENRKPIEKTTKSKLKVNDITKSESSFITKINKNVKSISSDDMTENTVLDESNPDIGEDDLLENSFEDSNTSEESMHVDTFMRT